MYLLAIDPSLNSAGAALFKAGVLISANTLKSSAYDRKVKDEMVRCVRIANSIVYWIQECHHRTRGCPLQVACEWPQVYTSDKSEIPPKAVIPMAGVSAAILALLWTEDKTKTSKCYLPGDWVQGTKKKDSKNIYKTSRAIRIISRLSPEEKVVFDREALTHDAIDAVGIGLHHLGRLKQRRAYHCE